MACWLRAVGCWWWVVNWAVGAVGCGLLAVGCELWAVGCGLSAVACRLLAAGCVLLAVCCWLWAVVCGLLAVGCRFWAVGCGLFAVGCGRCCIYTTSNVSKHSLNMGLRSKNWFKIDQKLIQNRLLSIQMASKLSQVASPRRLRSETSPRRHARPKGLICVGLFF